MSTPTPEADAAEVRRRQWAENLVLSFLTPTGGFVHPSYMVEAFADALRSAEKDAALAMRDRAARVVDDYDIDFKSPPCCRVAAERTAERLADAVRSLETAPPDAMRAAGWVRAEDVLARAGALQAYLKDRWGSAAERAVARHFQNIFDPSAPEAPP